MGNLIPNLQNLNTGGSYRWSLHLTNHPAQLIPRATRKALLNQSHPDLPVFADSRDHHCPTDYPTSKPRPARCPWNQGGSHWGSSGISGYIWFPKRLHSLSPQSLSGTYYKENRRVITAISCERIKCVSCYETFIYKTQMHRLGQLVKQ